jgi:uncharacterized protein
MEEAPPSAAVPSPGGYLARPAHSERIRELLAQFPVVALIGARQVGKTTLARRVSAEYDDTRTFFDLEKPADLRRLREPDLVLEPLRGLVVLDEIHQLPEVFPLLRVLADRPERPATFLVLGSASPDLLRQSSESLAGRIAYHQLPGLSLSEVGVDSIEDLWLRGGFPSSFLAPSSTGSLQWRLSFIQTFLGRDLPGLGIQIEQQRLRRFWTMVAHYHGQVWNASELARSLGVDSKTVARYVDLLVSTFVVTRLAPWHENLGKRQVKSPKVYITDSGLLHGLLGQPTYHDLLAHPKLGSSWEGFLLHQLRMHLRARDEECYFWATHAGAEIDLLVVRGRRRLGFEFKRASAPRLTPSTGIALRDLRLDRLDVLHAGEHTFPMAKNIRAVAARRMLEDIEPLD